MSQAPDNSNLKPHQQEAMDHLTQMRHSTVDVDATGGNTFMNVDVTPGGGKTGSVNPLHKAGQKMVDTLIARYGKEGAQQILSRRLNEANRKRIFESITPVARIVQAIRPASPEALVNYEIDMNIVRYFQRLQVKAALTQRLDKSEVKAAMDGLEEVITDLGGDVTDLSETDYLTQGVNGARLDESIKQLESGSVMHVQLGDEGFEPSDEELSQLTDIMQSADSDPLGSACVDGQEEAGDETYALESDGPQHSDEFDNFDIDALDVPDADIEYQENDGNSDCGDSCSI